MKNTFKLFGFIALVAVIAVLAGCVTTKVVDVEWDTLEGPSRARQHMTIGNSEVKVYASYEDGTRKQSSASALYYDISKVGPQTVTVRIGDNRGGTFQTEVMELTGIYIASQPKKTVYNVGEKYEVAGLKVMGTWNDMPELEISSFIVMLNTTGPNSSTPGVKVMTVNYNGKKATFNLTVQ